MWIDIQRASITRRLGAFFLDLILLAMLAMAAGTGLLWAFDYDGHQQVFADACEACEAEYGVKFQINQEIYDAMTPEEQANWDAAYEALCDNPAAMQAYNMCNSLSLLTATLAVLVACGVLEFGVPMLLKNGQTLGKKLLGIGVIRKDGVKMSTVQLFVRAFLGKFTIGTMLPVYIVILVFNNQLGLLGTVILGILTLVQCILLLGRDHALIQDRMAGTLVVEMATQQIFDTEEEMIEYTKRLHAEAAERQTY